MWCAMCHCGSTQHVHVYLCDYREAFCCGVCACEHVLCLGVSVWLWMSVRVLYVRLRVHLCGSVCLCVGLYVCGAVFT